MLEQRTEGMSVSETEPASGQQISILSMLWVTTCTALLLAYARSLGTSEIQLALIYLGITLAIGIAVGFLTGQVVETLFWTSLTCLLAYLAVAGGRLPNYSTSIAWGSVGAVCGAYCAATSTRKDLEIQQAWYTKRLWLLTIGCGLAAVLAMLSTLWILQEPITMLMKFDIASTFVVGMILKPFLVFLKWFEKQSKQPRIVLASWLTLTILIGNYLVPVLAGVQR